MKGTREASGRGSNRARMGRTPPLTMVGKPAPEATERPKTPVSVAMRTHAEESRAFIADVLAALPYIEYSDRVTLQVFEQTLYLAASDLWEDVDDEDRLLTLRNRTKMMNMRMTPLYDELTERLKEESARVRDAAFDDEPWLERESRVAKRALSHVLRHGSTNSQERVGLEILDRKMPKKARVVEGGEAGITFTFPAEVMLLMTRAAAEAGKALQPFLDIPVLEEKVVSPAPEALAVIPNGDDQG